MPGDPPIATASRRNTDESDDPRAPALPHRRQRLRETGQPALVEFYDLTTSDTPACPADLNMTCTVDLNDVLVLLSQFGESTPGPYRGADTDGDAEVDLADLLVVLASFGADCP